MRQRSGDRGSAGDGVRPVVVIQPPRVWGGAGLRETWMYRDLWLMLSLRHLQLRYRQTALGVFWAVLQPLLAALVFTVVFRGLVGQTDQHTYLLFSYSGMVGWLLLAAIVSEGSTSLVANANLITKVFFPRVLLPLATLGFALLDFALGLVVLAVIALFTGGEPGVGLLLLPLVVVGIVTTALAVAIFCGGLAVKFRDFRFIVPFALQIWFFVSPVVYPVDRLPERVQQLVLLNPMTGWIEGLRFCLLATPVDPLRVVVAAGVTAVMMAGALACFRWVELDFADVI